jgi:hypothetical protein
MATYRTFSEHEAKTHLTSWGRKTCAHCQQRFWGRGSAWAGPYFCSNACQRAARNARRRNKRKAEQMYQSRPTGTCARCGAGLWLQQRATRRYCSDACRQKAYRDRQGAGGD